VKWLILFNGLVYLMQMIIPSLTIERLFALQPLSGGIGPFRPWQLVTYSFLHGNGLHLLINMFILWMFGLSIENFWGTKKFLGYYFICVVGAGICNLLLAPGTVAVGASGGIYGMLLAFGFLFPDAIIYLFFLFPLRARQAVFIMGLLTLALAVNSGGSRIAHFAHLGGMLTGFLFFKIPQWLNRLHWWRVNLRFRFPKTPWAGKKNKERINLAAEVDRILEKISSKGVGSLTPEEHEIMRRYAEKKT